MHDVCAEFAELSFSKLPEVFDQFCFIPSHRDGGKRERDLNNYHENPD